MKLPRVRLTVMGLIAAVAVVAVGLAVMVRRHPIGGMAVATLGVVWWSDGSVTKGNTPVPANFVGFGPLLKVEWSDQSKSWYLGWNARTDSVYCREQAMRCVETLRSDHSESQRDYAAKWIALNAELIEPDLVVPTLAVAANDPSRKVRLSAVGALDCFISRSPSVAPALALALRDEDALVRTTAAYALKDNRTNTDQVRQVAIPALARALNDPNDTVRCSVAKSLVALGAGDKAVPAMVEVLRHHNANQGSEREKNYSRQSAIEVLEMIGPGARPAVPMLVEAMTDNDSLIRVSVAAALVSLGEPAVALPVLHKVGADENKDSLTRSIADRALKKIEPQACAEQSRSQPSEP